MTRYREIRKRVHELRAGLRTLPQEITPERNLWPGIAERQFSPTSATRWQRVALRLVAAITVFAAGAWWGSSFAVPSREATGVIALQASGSRLLDQLIVAQRTAATDQSQREALLEVAISTLHAISAQLQLSASSDDELAAAVRHLEQARGLPASSPSRVVRF